MLISTLANEAKVLKSLGLPKKILLYAAIAACSALAIMPSSARAAPPPQDLRAGIVISKIQCAAKPEQSYALYLPSNYSHEKRWPVVYVFDPGARGSMPVEIMKDAAERYGYIVAGSNNSRNGPTRQELDAAEAMTRDTQERLSIDIHRVYFAGLSGGARFAAVLAQGCKCAAGALLNSAGFSPSSPPAAEPNFPVFATAGTLDFNYPEVVELDAKLATLHYAHAFRRFDGPHEWAPAGVMEEAFAWFRLQAMKQGREPRDAAFVHDQDAQAEKRAKNFEDAGDLYSAWKEYRQAAATFDALGDAAPFRERAAALEKEKAVRDGAKREQQDFEEQSRLSGDIEAAMSALLEGSPDRAVQARDVEQQIADLRSRAEHEKNAEKLQVAKRALGGIFIEAMESGRERSEAKDNSLARFFFEIATAADPDSSWAWSDLAATRALDGDRKSAFEALRRAKEKTKDPAAFSRWLTEESAFSKFRDTPEFRALLDGAEVSR